MALKIGGTTVIDDSANITTSVGGFKTINSNSITGSGDIAVGASTTLGAVGTYLVGTETTMTDHYAYKAGRTASGSNIRSASIFAGLGPTINTATSTSGNQFLNGSNNTPISGSTYTDNQSYSGSWRMMSTGAIKNSEGNLAAWEITMAALWVRYA
jgi:hypothetical protein